MRRDRVITVRVSDDEFADLRRYADLSGQSLSDYVRNGSRPSLVITGTSGATVTWTVA